jgi:hypothetical protein
MLNGLMWCVGFAAMLVSLGCGALILLHAFTQSPGTGFMTLCIPFFVFLYAFRHFEHERKGWVVAGFIGGWGLGVVLQLASGGGAAALIRGVAALG